MKKLNEILNAYFGKRVDRSGALREAGNYGVDADEVISTIDTLVNLDVPASSSFFMRQPPERFERLGQLSFDITGSYDKAVPWFSPTDLARQSPDIREKYKVMLNELYELAVMLIVAGKHLGSKESFPRAVQVFQHYCTYARGHETEKDRLRIADQQIRNYK